MIEPTTFASLVRGGKLAVGDGYRAKNSELGSDGPVFLRSAYLQDSGWALGNEPDRMAEVTLDRFGPKVARLEDTVLTTKGNSLGRLGIIDNTIAGAVYSPHLSYWRSLDQSVIVPRFLYYWAKGLDCQRQVQAMSHQTDMAPYFSLGDQLSLKIELPEATAQQAIAELLGALDDKIEANRRMNETLEGLARALFKSWFIDFDPVRAKADGRGTGLSPVTAAAFPDGLDDSATVPVGWTRRPLSSCARFLNGLALQKYPALEDGFLPVIKIAELRAGRWNEGDKAALSIPPEFVVDDGDLLFSWSGSLIHRIWCGGRGALNQHLFKVTSDTLPQWFLFEAIQQHMTEFRAIAADKATTMGHIQRRHLDEAMVAVPDLAVLQVADQILTPIYDRMLLARKQSRTLAALRDLLLPRLMSGAISVGAADEAVASAL